MPIIAEEQLQRAWNDEQWNPDLPPELREFFVENQMENQFTAQLKQFSNPEGNGRPRIVASFRNNIPTYDVIAESFGVGKYRMTFMYKDATKQPKTKDFDFELYGPHYENMFRTKQDTIKHEQKEKQEEELQTRALENKWLGPPATVPYDPMKAGQEYMKGISEFMTPMMNHLVPAKSGGGDMMAIAGIMTTAMQENTKMMMMMMQQSTTMTMAMLNRNPAEKEESSLMKAMEIMKNILEMKNDLTPKEETTFDKVSKMIEAFGSTIAAYLASRGTPMGMAMKPAIEQIKKSEEIETIRNSPKLQEKLCQELDKEYNQQDADAIMQTLGFNRPASCPAPVDDPLPDEEVPMEDATPGEAASTA